MKKPGRRSWVILPVASALVLVLYTSNGHQRLVGSPSCQQVRGRFQAGGWRRWCGPRREGVLLVGGGADVPPGPQCSHAGAAPCRFAAGGLGNGGAGAVMASVMVMGTMMYRLE